MMHPKQNQTPPPSEQTPVKRNGTPSISAPKKQKSKPTDHNQTMRQRGVSFQWMTAIATALLMMIVKTQL